jgi:hypothetical protein
VILAPALTNGLVGQGRLTSGKVHSSEAFLAEKSYAGIVDVPEYGVRNKRGDFEPLISEQLFYRVQAIVWPCAEHGTSQARASRLSVARFRPLRIVRARVDGQLVDGPQ